MPASLDDILTTQKNGVVALGSISTSLTGLYAYAKGSALSSGEAGTGGYVTLYTVPNGTQMAIVDIEVCNTSSSPATFYISLVPAGNIADATNALFYNAPINGNTTVQWTGNQVLTAGSFVAAYASSSDVTIKIGGAPGQ